MGNILGTNPTWFRLLNVSVPEQSRKGSGECLYLLVQENIVNFGQSTQDAGLCLAAILGLFFSDPALNFLKNLSYNLLGDSRGRCVLGLAVPKKLLCLL